MDRQGKHALAEYTLMADGGWVLAPSWRLRGRLRAFTEHRLEREPRNRLQADELYLERSGTDCTARLGTQQVVWGLADKLRVLDVIHPFDLREGFFGDLVRTRRPLFMLNAECGAGEESLQWLLISQTLQNLSPDQDGRFAVATVENTLAARGVPIRGDRHVHAGDPSDWSSGLKWSDKLGDADLTLNAFHGWQPESILRPEASAGGLIYHRDRKRFTMVGGSVAMPLGAIVVKGEWSLIPDATRYYVDGTGAISPQRAREKRGLLAMDYQMTDWFFGMQLYESHATVSHASLEPSQQRLITFSARREFLQGRMELTAYVAHDVKKPAQYAAVETRYNFNSHWQGRLNVDYFRGDEESFGRFNRQSRLVLGLRYSLY